MSTLLLLNLVCCALGTNKNSLIPKHMLKCEFSVGQIALAGQGGEAGEEHVYMMVNGYTKMR